MAAFLLASGSKTGTLLAIALAAAPLLIYMTIQPPFVFPFGLYAALVPFKHLIFEENAMAHAPSGGRIQRTQGNGIEYYLLPNSPAARAAYAQATPAGAGRATTITCSPTASATRSRRCCIA